MVKNLRLLFQDVETVNIGHFGSLRDWIHEATDKKYWNQLIKCLLHPDTPLLERPEAWGLLPSWRAQRAASSQHPAPHDEDGNEDGEDSGNNGNNVGGNNRRDWSGKSQE